MERREYSRYLVSLEIEIQETGSSFALRGNTTDVSLGGCYVATIFPLAVGSEIHFKLRVADEDITARGSVQTSHPSVGMGIRFIGLADKDRRRLDKYLLDSEATLPERMLASYLR